MERRLLRVIRGQDCREVTSAVGKAYFDTGTSVIVKRAEGTGWAGVPQEAGTGLCTTLPSRRPRWRIYCLAVRRLRARAAPACRLEASGHRRFQYHV